MSQSALVLVELLVLDHGRASVRLLKSFAKMVKENILEEGETAGVRGEIGIEGLGVLPAHRYVRWEDLSAEEAIDQWVEEQKNDAPAFVVILAYSHPSNQGLPLLAWARAPGQQPHTVGGIPGSQVSALLGVSEKDAWEHPDFTKVAATLLFDHPEMGQLHPSINKLRSEFEATQINLTTPQTPPRSGPRL